MNIDLAYLILFAVISVIGILGASRKMSMGVALIGIALGLAIVWVLAPYMSIVMEPVGQAIFYGGSWTISAILGLTHLTTLIIMVILAGYNLASSGGKIVWA